jgi:hypothetical protein
VKRAPIFLQTKVCQSGFKLAEVTLDRITLDANTLEEIMMKETDPKKLLWREDLTLETRTEVFVTSLSYFLIHILFEGMEKRARKVLPIPVYLNHNS